MKLVNFYRKPISVFVMFTFTILLCFWANQVPAAEKNSETTLEQGESNSPNFIEQENEVPAKVGKSHKFPWFLVGTVVVVGAAAAYYFLVLNKKYTLTVNVGAGSVGTPALTGKYKKGEGVPYSYSLQAGYGSLLVKLDGVAVAASGTVTMDKNHILEVSATKEYTLTVHLGTGTTGTPAATATYKEGLVVNYNYSAQAGYSNLQVKLDGVAVAANGTVTMNNNHTLDVSAATQQYTLTVHLGTGTTGTPAATASYPKSHVVSYSYTAQAGYSNLQVWLDGALVPASGTVTMNIDHTLDVQATLTFVKRVVVAEEFTATWCGYCPGAAMGLDQLKNEHSGTLTVIAYHNTDSFAYPDIYDARKSYYGVNGIPNVIFDGLESVLGGSETETQYLRYKAAYDRRAGISPQVKFRLLAPGGNTIKTEITNVSGQTLAGTFHFLIVEDNIPFPWLNQSIVRFVCRSMLPNANGEAITLVSGQMKAISRTYSISSGWNKLNCHIVIFVQGNNKEIYQGIQADLPD